MDNSQNLLQVERQKTKLEFLNKENDCLRQEVNDLTVNLAANKQIMMDL
jgi:cell division protein FtsB